MTPPHAAVAARCLALAARPQHRERVHRAQHQARCDVAAVIDARGADRRPQIVADCDEDAAERGRGGR